MTVEDVPAPQVSPKAVLVRVEYSCISAGTEIAALEATRTGNYVRSWLHADRARRVLKALREHGMQTTLRLARSRIGSARPTGYSAAGMVVAVGGEAHSFRVGDRVACAGAGIANHCEFIDVPTNLAVRVPPELGLREASTVTPGAIAMQAVRRAAPTLGETAVVIGLGVLGQLLIQLLRANGCRVIGVDRDATRVALSREHGADVGIVSERGFADQIVQFTDQVGADFVLVAAATNDNDTINEAMRSSRKKGRIVIVGDVGLGLERAALYEKELDVLISTSYGPGRYDPAYEVHGNDYPLAYVRWTENRNMAEYLRLAAAGIVSLTRLWAEPIDVDRAPQAYELLRQPGDRPLLITLGYSKRKDEPRRRVNILSAPFPKGRIQVAVAGAGGFAQSVHLPNLVRLNDIFAVTAIMSRTGATAKSVAERFGAHYATTDYSQLLRDDNVDALVIATRHHIHASMVLEALRHGKHVFVEKPLALNVEELAQIEEFFQNAGDTPVLLTGFNRRFSPAMSRIKTVIQERQTPLMVNYRMNAGYLPMNCWVQGSEGGGRNLGEACHIYDLFSFLTGAQPIKTLGAAIAPPSIRWAKNDNFVATISYADGSLCTLTYTALGSTQHPKERMDLFVGGKVVTLDDYHEVVLVDEKRHRWASPNWGKGHREEIEAFGKCIREGGEWPISLEEQFSVTRIGFEVERLLDEPLQQNSALT